MDYLSQAVAQSGDAPPGCWRRQDDSICDFTRRSSFQRALRMTHALLGSVVEKYYQQIDANDLDSVLMLFAADACYERADAVFADKAAIEIFS
jgi:hypothetical protein